MDNELINSKIAIIDDMADELCSYQNALVSTFPFEEIVPSKGGVKGMDIIKANYFSLVISDYNMPSINGLQLLEEVYKLSPSTKLVLLSGFVISRDVKERCDNINALIIRKENGIENFKDKIYEVKFQRQMNKLFSRIIPTIQEELIIELKNVTKSKEIYCYKGKYNFSAEDLISAIHNLTDLGIDHIVWRFERKFKTLHNIAEIVQKYIQHD